MNPSTPWLQRGWVALQRSAARWRLRDRRFAFMWDPSPDNEWVALDCEATGLSVQDDEIIAIGAVRIVGSRLLTSKRLELLVKPSRAISADAAKLHGLRARDVAQGLAVDEALQRLLHFIGSRPLVGYFLDFDLGLINRALAPLLGVALPQPFFDVSSMFYEWKFNQLPPYQQQGNVTVDLSFSSLLRDLELPEWPAHGALDDAVMAGLAFLKLKRLLGR